MANGKEKNILIPDDLNAELKKIAIDNGITLKTLTRKILNHFMKSYEKKETSARLIIATPEE